MVGDCITWWMGGDSITWYGIMIGPLCSVSGGYTSTPTCGDTSTTDCIYSCRYSSRTLVTLSALPQKYIYRPVLGSHSSLLARLASSAVCFSFVYVWHGGGPPAAPSSFNSCNSFNSFPPPGTLDFVMIWSALNFAGITAEGLARWNTLVFQFMCTNY